MVYEHHHFSGNCSTHCFHFPNSVRVRAVVMTRDDSSGGWVPLGGGGLSHVVICKGRSSEGRGRREYVIRGERLRDRAPVLECAIQKGLVYNKVNPIFHHWRVEERKFGLTFQSPADAISFERGLQSVLEKLDRGTEAAKVTPGMTKRISSSFGRPNKVVSLSQRNTEHKHTRVFTTWQQQQYDSENKSYTFFLCLCVVRFEKELAGVGTTGCEVTVMLDTKGSQLNSSPTCMPNAVPGVPSASSSPQETGKGSPSPCCIHTSLATPRSRTRKRGGSGGEAISPDDDSSCPQGSSSCSSRCVYCRSVFSASENGRGRCRDAPDPALHCLRQWTCVWCAESLLYHCMSDSEGEFWEPCSCEDSMGRRPHPLCCARWMALLALSLFVPCMCCYLPLHACLRCGERCGCCGGKHKAVR
uniref:Sprouty related EVH1 domain containing 3 n=2 Tax=Sinocyclocheilus TaxID=75365 RepID=A0A672JZ90_SINGR